VGNAFSTLVIVTNVGCLNKGCKAEKSEESVEPPIAAEMRLYVSEQKCWRRSKLKIVVMYGGRWNMEAKEIFWLGRRDLDAWVRQSPEAQSAKVAPLGIGDHRLPGQVTFLIFEDSFLTRQ
jgi:hypothetical protein